LRKRRDEAGDVRLDGATQIAFHRNRDRVRDGT